AGVTQTYVILYKTQSVSSDAAAVIAKAGGTLVYNYKAIGVVIASSSNDLFRSNLMRDKRVEGAAATTNFATHLDHEVATDEAASPLPDSAPASDTDSLSGLQWDMVQIHTP